MASYNKIDVLPFLYPGKGQRVCDVRVYFPGISEEVVYEVLEDCVYTGHAEKNTQNGLSKTSAIDCFQIKNFSHERFVEKLGSVDALFLATIHATIVKALNPLYSLQK